MIRESRTRDIIVAGAVGLCAVDMHADIESMTESPVAIAKELACAGLVMETATMLEPDVDGLRRCARSSRAAERNRTRGGG